MFAIQSIIKKIVTQELARFLFSHYTVSYVIKLLFFQKINSTATIWISFSLTISLFIKYYRGLDFRNYLSLSLSRLSNQSRSQLPFSRRIIYGNRLNASLTSVVIWNRGRSLKRKNEWTLHEEILLFVLFYSISKKFLICETKEGEKHQ